MRTLCLSVISTTSNSRRRLKIHEGDHMTNMINKVDESDRYTYLYQGNSQVLDHILVSNNLVEQPKSIFFISMQILRIWQAVQVIMILY